VFDTKSDRRRNVLTVETLHKSVSFLARRPENLWHIYLHFYPVTRYCYRSYTTSELPPHNVTPVLKLFSRRWRWDSFMQYVGAIRAWGNW